MEKLESVKLPKSYLKKVRNNKKATGVSIMAFICQAIDEKLSEKAHREFHTKYGKNNNTLDQLNEFLSNG